MFQKINSPKILNQTTVIGDLPAKTTMKTNTNSKQPQQPTTHKIASPKYIAGNNNGRRKKR